jgi:hypothetical protein
MKSRDMGMYVIWMQNRSIYDLFINLNYFLYSKIGQTFKHTCDHVGYIIVQRNVIEIQSFIVMEKFVNLE